MDTMPSKYLIFVPITLACWLEASAQAPAAPAPESGVAVHSASMVSALDGQLFYQLLQGELYARTDDPGAAYALILGAAYKTQSAELYRRAVQIALQARSGDSSLAAAKAWSTALPSSREANRYVLQILLKLNRPAQTIEPLRRYLALTPVTERQDAVWEIYRLFEGVSDKPLAASIVQKALRHELHDPQLGAAAWATVGRMWLNAGDTRAALMAATKGQALGVWHERPALLAMSILTVDAHYEQQTQNIIQNHLASQHARPEFALIYARVLLKAKHTPEALALLQTIHVSHPGFADAWLTHGAVDMEEGHVAQAKAHFQRYIDGVTVVSAEHLRPEVRLELSKVYLSMAQIAEQSKDWLQADAWLKRVEHPDVLVHSQIRRAHLVAMQGQLNDAITMLHQIPEGSDADVRIKRAAEVQLLRDAGRYERARAILEEALAQSPQDVDLIYDLSLVAEQMGDLTTMERLLRQLIAARPDDPQAYNALGYSLADRSLRLPEARSLIVKALELAPGDPFITDSLGWAEFRMGEHARALQLLQSAYQQKPDAEIAAHLGEVLWSVKRQQDALQIWREALRLSPDNATLANTLKRLRVTL